MPEGDFSLIEVRSSPVHGNGVFALADIRRGAFVCEYRGEIISREIMLARDAERSRGDSVFVFEIDEENFLDASRVSENNPARFINHSCSENCEAVWNASARRMEIRAVRDIRAGEEISFDYGFGLAGFFENPCRCGAANCAHFIVAKILRPALARKLARHQARRKSSSGSEIATGQWSEPSTCGRISGASNAPASDSETSQ